MQVISFKLTLRIVSGTVIKSVLDPTWPTKMNPRSKPWACTMPEVIHSFVSLLLLISWRLSDFFPLLLTRNGCCAFAYLQALHNVSIQDKSIADCRMALLCTKAQPAQKNICIYQTGNTATIKAHLCQRQPASQPSPSPVRRTNPYRS